MPTTTKNNNPFVANRYWFQNIIVLLTLIAVATVIIMWKSDNVSVHDVAEISERQGVDDIPGGAEQQEVVGLSVPGTLTNKRYGFQLITDNLVVDTSSFGGSPPVDSAWEYRIFPNGEEHIAISITVRDPEVVPFYKPAVRESWLRPTSEQAQVLWEANRRNLEDAPNDVIFWKDFNSETVAVSPLEKIIIDERDAYTFISEGLLRPHDSDSGYPFRIKMSYRILLIDLGEISLLLYYPEGHPALEDVVASIRISDFAVEN